MTPRLRPHERASIFVREHILGMVLFGVFLGILGNFAYDQLKGSKDGKADTGAGFATPTVEIGSLLNSCHNVSPNIARFVVIPTTPTGLRDPNFVLRFTGVIGKNISTTRHAVLAEGIERGVLKIHREKYVFALWKPDTRDVVTSLTASGMNAFDVEKRNLDEVAVAFFLGSSAPPQATWNSGFRTAALAGKCNLINLVILPTDTP